MLLGHFCRFQGAAGGQSHLYTTAPAQMIPIGSTFTVLAATDVSKDPSTLQAEAAKQNSGRLIDIDPDDTIQQDDDWCHAHRESNRCLKLALRCDRTGQMKIGVELEKMAWSQSSEAMAGMQLRVTGPVECMGDSLLLTGTNCLITSSPGGTRPFEFGNDSLYDVIDDDAFTEIINLV